MLDLLLVSEILLAVIIVRFLVVALDDGVFAAEMRAELRGFEDRDLVTSLVYVVASVVAFLLAALVNILVFPVAIFLIASGLITDVLALLDVTAVRVLFLANFKATLVELVAAFRHLLVAFLVGRTSYSQPDQGH